MTLEDIYLMAGSDIEEVLKRIQSKPVLLRLVKMFVNDPNKSELDDAIKNKDSEKAFTAVHTLKGVCLGLGLDSVSGPAVELTENLRGGSFEEGWEENYNKLCEEYDKIIRAIKELS